MIDFSVLDLPIPRLSMNPAYCGGRCKTCRSNKTDPSKNQVLSDISEVPEGKEAVYSVRYFVKKRRKTESRQIKKKVSKIKKGKVRDKDEKTNRKKKIEKFCSLCNLSEKSLLGQGKLKHFKPSEGFDCFKALGQRGVHQEKKMVVTMSETGSELKLLFKKQKVMNNPGEHVNLHRSKSFQGLSEKPSMLTNPIQELEVTGFKSVPESSDIFEKSGELYTHFNCAAWSDGVTKTSEKHLSNVDKAVVKAAFQKCSKCNCYGASVRCCVSDCTKIYHYPCAIVSGALQNANCFKIVCSIHLEAAFSFGVICMACHENGDLSQLLLCTSCSNCYHGNCMDPPIIPSPDVRAGWQCKVCQNRSLSIYEELVKIYEESNAVRRNNAANAAALSNATDLQNQHTTFFVTDSGTTTTTIMTEQEMVTAAPAASHVESLTSSKLTIRASGASTAPAVVPVSELATVQLVASPRSTKTTAATAVANQMSPQITAEKNLMLKSQIQAKRQSIRLQQKFFIKHNYVENLATGYKLVLKLHCDKFILTIMTPSSIKEILWSFLHVQDDVDEEAVSLIKNFLESVDREEIPHFFFDILDHVGENPERDYVYKYHVVLQIEMYAAGDEFPVFSCFLLLKPTLSTWDAFIKLYQAKMISKPYLSKMSMPLYLDALDKGFSYIDNYSNIYGNAFVSRMTINFSLNNIYKEMEEKLKSNWGDDLKSNVIKTPLECFPNLWDESPSYIFDDVAEELELYLKMKINDQLSQYITKNKITVTILNVIDPAHFVVKSPELSEKPFSPDAKSFSEAEEAMNKFYASVKGSCNAFLSVVKSPELSEKPFSPEAKNFSEAEEAMNKLYASVKGSCKTCLRIIVTFYEGKFYRGKVIKILTESDGHLLFKIYLVDYGIECSVTRDCIYKMEEDFLVYPFQAVNFKLLGLEPRLVSNWDPSSKIFVHDLLEGKKNAYIEVQGIEGENMYGKLYVTDENMTTKCVNDELKSNSFAYFNEDCWEKKRSLVEDFKKCDNSYTNSISKSSNPEQMASPSNSLKVEHEGGFWKIFTPGRDSCWSTTEVREEHEDEAMMPTSISKENQSHSEIMEITIEEEHEDGAMMPTSFSKENQSHSKIMEISSKEEHEDGAMMPTSFSKENQSHSEIMESSSKKLVEVFHFHVKDKTDRCKIFVFVKEEVFYTVYKFFDTSTLEKNMNHKLMLLQSFCNGNRDELDRYIFHVAKVLSNAFNTSLLIEHEIPFDTNTHIIARFKFEDRIQKFLSKFNVIEEKEPMDSEDVDEENTEEGTQKYSDISDDDMDLSQEKTKVSDDKGEDHMELGSSQENELCDDYSEETKKTSDDERNIMPEIYKVSPEGTSMWTVENLISGDRESEIPSMMTKSEEQDTNFEEEGAESLIRNDLTFEGKETECIFEAHPFEKVNEYIFEALSKCNESETLEDQQSNKKRTALFYPSLNSEFNLEGHGDIEHIHLEIFSDKDSKILKDFFKS